MFILILQICIRLFFSVFCIPNADLDVAKNIRVIENLTTGDSLTVQWDHAEGRKDNYLLRCGSTEVKVESSKTRGVCTNLKPTKEYAIHVVTQRKLFDDTVSQEVVKGMTSLDKVVLSVANTTIRSIFFAWTKARGGKHNYTFQYSTTKNGPVIASLNTVATFLRLTKLVPGTAYFGTVTTKRGNFDDVVSNPIRAKTRLLPVKNVRVKQRTTEFMVMWWHAEGSKDSYKLECEAPDGTFTEVRVPDYQTSATCSSLKPGTDYAVTVRTVKAGFRSTQTKVGAKTVLENVGSIDVSSPSPTKLHVSWKRALASHHDAIVVKCGKQEVIPKDNPTHATCAGLVPGSLYNVSVVTMLYDFPNASTPVAPYRTALDKIDITGVVATATTLKVMWKKSDGEKDEYLLQCRSVETLKSVPMNALKNEGTCTELVPGTTYTVVVMTKKEGFSNVESDPYITKTKLQAPTIKPAQMSSSTEIEVSWNAVKGHFTQYFLTCEFGGKGTEHNYSASLRAGVCSGLTPGTQYSVKVGSRMDGFEDASSSPVMIKTDLAKVEDITAVRVTTTAVYANWTEPSGIVDRYTLRCGNRTSVEVVYPTNYGECRGLVSGTEYDVSVTSSKLGHSSVTSHAIQVQTVLGIVGNLSVTETSATEITVSWKEADGEKDNYELTCVTGSHFPIIVSVPSSQLTGTCRGLTPGSTYCVIVATKKKTFTSRPSNLIYQKTKLHQVSFRQSSSQPTTIQVTWTAAEGNFDSYELSCSGPNGRNHSFAIAKDLTSGKCTGLIPGSLYRVVVATQLTGFRDASSTSRSIKTRLSTVTNVDLIGRSTDVSVTWSHAQGNRDGYNVTCSGPTILVKVVDNGTDKTDITNLTPGTIYFVVVTTFKATFESESTEPKRLRTSLATAQGVQVTSKDSRTIDVFFNKSGYFDYFVLQCLTDGIVQAQDIIEANENTGTCDNLIPGTRYSVNVTTVKQGFDNVTTGKFEAADGDRVSNVQTSSSPRTIDVSWEHASGNRDGYVTQCVSSVSIVSSTILPSATTSWQCKDLVPGSEYQVTVTTILEEVSNRSSIAKTEKTELGKVTSVRIDAVRHNSIEVSFNDAAGNKDKYIIRCQIPGQIHVQVHVTRPTGVCSHLTPGSQYDVTVTTRRAGYHDQTTYPVAVNTSLEPVAKVQIINKTQTALDFSFDRPSGTFDYLVLRCSAQGTNTAELTIKNKDSAQCAALTPGTNYSVEITTVKAGFDNVTSLTFGYTALDRVVVTVDGVTTTIIRLSWTPARGMKNGYTVTCVSNSHGVNFTVRASVSRAECTQLKPGTIYGVSVETNRVGWTSVKSDEQKTITVPMPVKNVQSRTTLFSINVTWDQPLSGDVTHYLVKYRKTSSNAQLNQLDEVSKDGEREVTIKNLLPGESFTIEIATMFWNNLYGNRLGRIVEIEAKTRLDAVKRLMQDKQKTTSTTIPLSWNHAVCSKDAYVLNCTSSINTFEYRIGSDRQKGTCGALTQGLVYNVTVTTVKEGYDNATAIISAKTKLAEVLVTNIMPTTKTITVLWNHTLATQMFYTVTCSRNSDQVVVSEKNSTTNTATCSGLIPGSKYDVQVTTKKEGFDDARPQANSTHTDLDTVRGLHVTSRTDSQITVAWIDGAEGNKDFYRLMCQNSALTRKYHDTYLAVDVNGGACSNLNSGFMYKIWVETWKSGVRPKSTESVSSQTKLTTVTGVHIVGRTSTSLEVHWTAAEGHRQFYEISCTRANSTAVTVKIPAGTSSGECESLEAGYWYNVTVATHLEGFESVTTHPLEEATDLGLVDIIHSKVSPNQIQIWWAPKGKAGGFVLRCFRGSWEISKSTKKEHGTCAGLTPGRRYDVTVTTTQTGFASRTTTPIKIRAGFAVVGNATIVSTNESNILVSWGAVDGFFEFYLLNCTHGDSTWSVNTTSKTKIACTHLTPGSDYNVTISTCINGPECSVSSPLHAKTMLAPVRNVTLFVNETTVTVTWSDPNAVHDGYVIEYSNGKATTTANQDVTSMNTTLTGLEPGTVYNITIRTKLEERTEAKKIITFATAPNPPRNVSAFMNGSSIVVTWEPPKTGSVSEFVLVYWPRLQNVTPSAPVVVSSKERYLIVRGVPSGTVVTLTLKSRISYNEGQIDSQAISVHIVTDRDLPNDPTGKLTKDNTVVAVVVSVLLVVSSIISALLLWRLKKCNNLVEDESLVTNDNKKGNKEVEVFAKDNLATNGDPRETHVENLDGRHIGEPKPQGKEDEMTDEKEIQRKQQSQISVSTVSKLSEDKDERPNEDAIAGELKDDTGKILTDDTTVTDK